ncbi:hypothetical protein, partial [Xylella fastidiosa]|uniref:hypothetical protein n=1 Tax=Xylella fastidiosa TaxID=2371 RepID=UPI001EECB7BE
PLNGEIKRHNNAVWNINFLPTKLRLAQAVSQLWKPYVDKQWVQRYSHQEIPKTYLESGGSMYGDAARSQRPGNVLYECRRTIRQYPN